MLLALTHGIKYGYKSSLSTALGNTTASVIQAIIAISGLSIILTTSQVLFEVIRYIGAVYLIYIGYMLFKSPMSQTFNTDEANVETTSHLSMFNQAFLVAISNPKAIIFFTALFPQFITEQNTPMSQYIFMTLTLGIIAFICMMIYSLAGHKASNFFKTSKVGQYLNKITGGIFIGAGCAVALKSA
ncbi:MAG: lysine transporter LysE [Sulfurimonas sp.]|nr:MAG: lysine transporter LysE [Sulfurimonas sp.]